MILPFIFWGTFFFGIFLLLLLIFRLFQINDMSIPFALSHVTILLIISTVIIINRKEPQIEFFWFIFFVIDFPVSLLYGFFKPIFLYIFQETDNNLSILSPLIFFAFFGTFQYYVVGKLFGQILQKRRNKKREATLN